MQRSIPQDIFGRDAAGCDRQAIERNVPNQFAPAFFHQLVDHLANDAGLLEFVGDSTSARPWRSNKFTNGEVSVIEMLNQTGRNAVETNKTKSTHYSVVAEMLSEKILVPQSILQGEQDGALVQERRN